MSSSKTKKGLYKEFFVGAEGTQYFINPMAFESKDGKSDMSLDITFRYKDEIKDSATVNFTIQDTELLKSMNELTIQNKKVKASTDHLTLLFNELNKKTYISRFSCKLTVSEINELFKESDWDILLSGESFNNTYMPTKGTQKAIEGMEQQLFILMK